MVMSLLSCSGWVVVSYAGGVGLMRTVRVERSPHGKGNHTAT
jgi:hypothetical protein